MARLGEVEVSQWRVGFATADCACFSVSNSGSKGRTYHHAVVLAVYV